MWVRAACSIGYLEQDRAIVTDIPGTTRDLVSEVAAIHGIPVKFVDTAGIRSGQDLVETLGIERSYQAMADADVTLVVLDLAAPIHRRRSGADGARRAARTLDSRRQQSGPAARGRPAAKISSRSPRSLAKGSSACANRSLPWPPARQDSGFITSIRHEQLLRESHRSAGAGSQSGRVRNPARNAAARSLRRAAAASTPSPAPPPPTTS